MSSAPPVKTPSLGPATPGLPALAYIVGSFPAASQQFIVREIRGLMDAGVPIQVFALGRERGSTVEPIDRSWQSKVHFVPWLPWPSLLMGHIEGLIRSPGAYFGALIKLLTVPHRPRYLLVRALLVFWRAAWIARKIRQAGGVAQVHAHFATGQTEMAWAVASLLGRHFSFTAHARDIYVTPNALPEKIRAASLVITCTQYNLVHLKSLCPELPAHRIFLVHHGIDLSSYAHDVEPSENRLDPPLFLSAGRLIEKKGFETLVQACAALDRQGIDFQCWIAGEGPLRSRLSAQIQKSSLSHRVRLLGWQSQAEMVRHYAAASIFVLPSRIAESGDRDGIPNVLLEALAARVPCISTSVSGIPEVVEHEVTGLLVPPNSPEELASALTRMLGDSGLRQALAANGHRKVVAEFDIAISTQRLVELFSEQVKAVPGKGR